MNLNDKNVLRNYMETTADSLLFPMLAELYVREGEIDEAIQTCREGLQKNPQLAAGYYMWALADIKAGIVDSGIVHLKQVIKRDPGFLEAYRKLVQYGEGTLDPRRLAEYYAKIVALDPMDDNAPQIVQRLKKGIAAFSKDGQTARPSAAQTPEPPQQEDVPQVQYEEPAPEVVEAPVYETRDHAGNLPDFNDEPVASANEILTEENSHLGPMETEVETPVEEVRPEAEEETVTAGEPVQADETPAPELSDVEQNLSDMFRKLRTRSLEELQSESWVAALVPDPAPKKEDPNPSAGPNRFRMEDSIVDEPVIDAADLMMESSDYDAEEEGEPEADSTITQATPAASKPARKSASKKSAANSERVELKIPIPTLTLVEVLKKQGLYDQALQVLNVLEAKSKDVERVQSMRAEIMDLKARE